MEKAQLEKLVNRSGFLFQMAVEEHIRSTSAHHDWKVIAHEYPWHSPASGRAGFIDIVASRGSLHAVLECKRTQGGEWIFLSQRDADETLKLRTHWSFLTQDKRQGSGWDDLHFQPASLESEFCIVRGSSDQDQPMLERLVSDLIRASESLAREDLQLQSRERGPAAFIPVIVTTARLFVCKIDPSDVDLSTGLLPASASFAEAEFVRFKKATASDVNHTPDTYFDFQDGLKRKERCAIVINVEYLSKWLASLDQQTRGVFAPPDPWRNFEGK